MDYKASCFAVFFEQPLSFHLYYIQKLGYSLLYIHTIVKNLIGIIYKRCLYFITFANVVGYFCIVHALCNHSVHFFFYFINTFAFRKHLSDKPVPTMFAVACRN